MDFGSLWLALAATLGALGAGWQTVTSVMFEIKSMDAFLAAHNQIIEEERARIRATIPIGRLIKRRRALQAAIKESQVVLTQSEQYLAWKYDVQSYGWSFVVLGASIACVLAWIEFANKLLQG